MIYKGNKLGFLISTVLFLLMISSSVALADVIYEPSDDFYHKHAKECENISENYLTNGPDGFVTLWASPTKKKKKANVINGTKSYVSFTYKDKKNQLWGCLEVRDEVNISKPKYQGWVLMSQLQLEYDNKCFCDEHKNEFKEYQGQFDHDKIKDPIVYWEYPGSKNVIKKTVVFNPDSSFLYTYEDEQKRLWGYFSDFKNISWGNKYAYVGSWICISDPTNEKLPVNDYHQPTIIPAAQETISENVQVEHKSTILLIAIPLIVLVAITGILIRLFWKKKQ